MYLLGVRNKRNELTAVVADFTSVNAAGRYARNMCQFYPADCTFVVMPADTAVRMHPEAVQQYQSRGEQSKVNAQQAELRSLSQRYFERKRKIASAENLQMLKALEGMNLGQQAVPA